MSWASGDAHSPHLQGIMARGIINSLKKRTVYEMTNINSNDLNFLLRAERNALAEIKQLTENNSIPCSMNMDYLNGKLHAYNEALELVERVINGDLALRTANI